jgi:hypothetical protein
VQAALFGVKLAAELGVSRIILETDSLLLKQALDDSSYGLAVTGGLICEIQVLLATNFSSFRVMYAPRTCNRVAHALAAIGCKYPHGDVLSWEGTPTPIEDLVPAIVLRLSGNGKLFS